MNEKKAYVCAVKDLEMEYGSIVVFAATRGKAIGAALHSLLFEDSDWRDIRCRRAPALDDCYRGKDEMDWNDDQDRLDMVTKLGFYCTDIDRDDCKACVARDECQDYQDFLYEEKMEWCEGCAVCPDDKRDPDNCEIYEAAHPKKEAKP